MNQTIVPQGGKELKLTQWDTHGVMPLFGQGSHLLVYYIHREKIPRLQVLIKVVVLSLEW